MTADPTWQEPEVHLQRWAFVRHPIGTIHVAGLRDGMDRLSRMRMSTNIVAFDRHALMAETASGRLYHLVEGGYSPAVGSLLASFFFGRAIANQVTHLSPEELELVLAGTPSAFRH